MIQKVLFLALAISMGSLCRAGSVKDSLLTALESTESMPGKFKILVDVSTLHSDAFELDSALFYAQQALDIAQSLQDPILSGEAYYALGYAYDLNGKLDEAFEQYELSRLEFIQTDNDEKIVQAMNGKGVAAFYAGDYGKALEYYLETLRYAEERGMKKRQADLLQNIANIYRRNSARQQESLDMYKRSYAIRKSLADTTFIARSVYSIAITYMEMGDFDNAKLYFDTSIYLNQLLKDTAEIGISYNELGHAYFEEQDYDNAKQHLSKAHDYLKASTNQSHIYRNLLSLGKVDTAQGKYLSAEGYFKQAYSVVRDTDYDDLKLSAFELLRDAQGKSGQYKLAFENSLRYEEVYNRLKSSEREKFVEELQTEYGVDQKEKQIEIQELKLLQASNQRRTYILLMSLLGLGVLSLVGFLYNKNRTNKILNQQKDQIQKSLDEKEILLREIHHRVKNNLQVISSLLKLQSRTVDDAAALSALQEGQNRVKSMALIHQNLYQEDNLTGVDVKDYFEKLTRHLFDSYKVSKDNIDLQLDICDIRLDVDTVIPLGLILNELISNALKYAFDQTEKGILSIRLVESTDQLILQVEDNGKGLQEVRQNVEDATSFGYSMIHTFADQLDGKLEFRSEKGTKVSLTLREYPKVA